MEAKPSRISPRGGRTLRVGETARIRAPFDPFQRTTAEADAISGGNVPVARYGLVAGQLFRDAEE